MRFIRQFFTVISLTITLAFSVSYAQNVQGDTYVTSDVDNQTPYVGQQIIYTLKFYDATGTATPLYQPSDFDGFWRTDIGVISQIQEEINGRLYTVTTIATALYPTRIGSLHIQPASIVLPGTILSASVITVQVLPLPVGQPMGFSGAVGLFNMDATLNQRVVQLGEPITMLITVSGTGNVEQLPPPSLPIDWRSSVTTEGYSNRFQNETVIGQQIYKVVFYPVVAGEQVLSPITLSYFDPQVQIYRSVSTPAVNIDVKDDVSNPNTQIEAVPENRLKLKPIQGVITNSSRASAVIFVILFALPIIASSVVLVWKRVETRRKRLAVEHRKQTALQTALQGIDNIKTTDERTAFAQFELVLWNYVVDKLGIRAVYRKRDLLLYMRQGKVPMTSTDLMKNLLNQIDERLYAPFIQSFAKEQQQEIKQLLIDIDKTWVHK